MHRERNFEEGEWIGLLDQTFMAINGGRAVCLAIGRERVDPI